MTVTKHTAVPSHDEQVAFGGYVSNGANHTVVAVRQRGGPWQPFEVTGDTVTLIERLFLTRNAMQCGCSPSSISRRCEHESDSDKIVIAYVRLGWMRRT